MTGRVPVAPRTEEAQVRRMRASVGQTSHACWLCTPAVTTTGSCRACAARHGRLTCRCDLSFRLSPSPPDARDFQGPMFRVTFEARSTAREAGISFLPQATHHISSSLRTRPTVDMCGWNPARSLLSEELGILVASRDYHVLGRTSGGGKVHVVMFVETPSRHQTRKGGAISPTILSPQIRKGQSDSTSRRKYYNPRSTPAAARGTHHFTAADTLGAPSSQSHRRATIRQRPPHRYCRHSRCLPAAPAGGPGPSRHCR